VYQSDPGESSEGVSAVVRAKEICAKVENRRAVRPGGSHASAIVSGGWEYDRRARSMGLLLGSRRRHQAPVEPFSLDPVQAAIRAT
jgi:hypothetical protein